MEEREEWSLPHWRGRSSPPTLKKIDDLRVLTNDE
jgi:hypothetical protein